MLQSDFCREAATNDIPGLGKVALEGSRFYAVEHLARRPEEITSETPENFASRRLPGMTQRNVLPVASFRTGDATTQRTAAPRDVPGSRPLQIDRAAMPQSGSPPGVGTVDTPRIYIATPPTSRTPEHHPRRERRDRSPSR